MNLHELHGFSLTTQIESVGLSWENPGNNVRVLFLVKLCTFIMCNMLGDQIKVGPITLSHGMGLLLSVTTGIRHPVVELAPHLVENSC